MGGAGYIFTGEHDADVMHNSASINLNTLEYGRKAGIRKFFYSSWACILSRSTINAILRTPSVLKVRLIEPHRTASTDGKNSSERLYFAYHRNYGVDVRVARFHNIFGPEGTWTGGREKAPAALCRKFAEAADGGEIEIWGDGLQTRSFLYIDSCIEAVRRLMRSNFPGPVNVGSEEMVSINGLAETIMDIAGKKLRFRHIPGPSDVRGCSSDNRLIRQLGWAPDRRLREGLEKTYAWIAEQVSASASVTVGAY